MGIKELSKGKSDIYQVSVHDFHLIEGWNRRSKRDNFQSLKAQIEDLGYVKLPVTGYFKDGQIVLVHGWGRVIATLDLLAEGKAVSENIPLKTVKEPKTDEEKAELLFSQALDNDSEPLSAYDLGKLFSDIKKEFNWTDSKIAQKYGKSAALIGQYLGVFENPEIATMVKNDEISMRSAIDEIKDNPETALEVLQEAVSDAKAEGKSKAKPKAIAAVKARKIDKQESPKTEPLIKSQSTSELLKVLLEGMIVESADEEQATITVSTEILNELIDRQSAKQ